MGWKKYEYKYRYKYKWLQLSSARLSPALQTATPTILGVLLPASEDIMLFLTPNELGAAIAVAMLAGVNRFFSMKKNKLDAYYRSPMPILAVAWQINTWRGSCSLHPIIPKTKT